ncbi:MAG TPA: OmpA family protein, partial [Gammaproteobacteria bacterium]|nr:OmpA family protein [Gammaproteobacteria bacterium]
LGDRDKARLDKVVEYAQADEGVKKVTVDAFTDASGYLRYNRELAQKRAAAVKQYLLDQGLSGSMLEVNAHGEKNPVASNASAQGRARNRRVVVRLVK